MCSVCLCHNLCVYRIVKSSRSWTPGSSRLWMVLTLFRLCWRKSWADSTEPKPQHESTRSRPLPGNWKRQERQQVNHWLSCKYDGMCVWLLFWTNCTVRGPVDFLVDYALIHITSYRCDKLRLCTFCINCYWFLSAFENAKWWHKFSLHFELKVLLPEWAPKFSAPQDRLSKGKKFMWWRSQYTGLEIAATYYFQLYNYTIQVIPTHFVLVQNLLSLPWHTRSPFLMR